jgi:hypothetical protein
MTFPYHVHNPYHILYEQEIKRQKKEAKEEKE